LDFLLGWNAGCLLGFEVLVQDLVEGVLEMLSLGLMGGEKDGDIFPGLYELVAGCVGAGFGCFCQIACEDGDLSWGE